MRKLENWRLLALAAGCCTPAAVQGTGTLAPDGFRVQLPAEARAFPEPLAPGRPGPGFRLRGMKGWEWTPRQYLEEIPYLAAFRMNFLMNCYLSLFAEGTGTRPPNEWWKPMSDERKREYSDVIGACRDHGITFCFSVHPQLASARPLDPDSPEDIGRLFQHYAWAQGRGVGWFSVCLDDVGWGAGGPAAGGAAHARLANTILGRLRVADPGAQLILCPAAYWGDGTGPGDRAYLGALARALHPDVYVFWTGDQVYCRRITRSAALSYRRAVGHRLFLWDNYPVNDGSPAMHLGPLSGRDPGLCDVVDGYMSNPMRTQNEINRIPAATCADYAYNPWAYDPARSIGQAILHLAGSAEERRALADLVEAYPGFIETGGDSRTNPVRAGFAALMAAPGGRAAAADLVRRTGELDARLERDFPGRYAAAKGTVAEDVAWMRSWLDSGR